MNCKDCENRKFTDAIEQLDSGLEWSCTKKHTECEDIICLLRMLIWEVAKAIEFEDEP